ncbi:uncharacterized protein LOC100277438 [Zea mays]|uniref:Zinc ion binding protein n=1 Tax=Zea mays TaxID=4577 RepID=K7TZ35_MAIZE|nr:uncharacterized protein LOC100277438 [Zea mays]AQK54098.1 Zinc ion binding protein [Zea mays]
MAGSTTTTAVCSMCGDVGFPDKLFRCARCRRRFQHSYCTNYYGDAAPAQAGAGVCDWCLRDDVGGGTKKRQHSSASAAACGGKQPHRQAEEEEEEEAAAAGWRRSAQHQPASSSSFPPSGGCSKVTGGSEHAEGGRRPRRYKLLKDVLC